MRNFKTWKMMVMVYLLKHHRDKKILINRLDKLRSRWLSSFLAELSRQRIDLPEELLPTPEEIIAWRREKV